VRIHHGYVGLVLLLIGMLVRNPGMRNIMLVSAIGLTGSDVVHHLMVLWPITGSPEFDLVYPTRIDM
jgi:hypothetical protein